jgi:hypothetical protein
VRADATSIETDSSSVLLVNGLARSNPGSLNFKRLCHIVRQALMLRLEKLESKSAAIPIDDDAQIFGRKFHAALGAICAFHVAGWREPEAPLIALARALGVTGEQAQLG